MYKKRNYRPNYKKLKISLLKLKIFIMNDICMHLAFLITIISILIRTLCHLSLPRKGCLLLADRGTTLRNIIYKD